MMCEKKEKKAKNGSLCVFSVLSETVCKSKWKSLRDNYRREYKKSLKNRLFNKKYKSGWMHFYHLDKFLEQVLDVKQIQNQILLEHSKDSSNDYIKEEMDEESEEIQEQNGYDDLNEDLDSEGMLTGLDAYNTYQIREDVDDENYDTQYDSGNWNHHNDSENFTQEPEEEEEIENESNENNYDYNQYIEQQQRQLMAQKRHTIKTHRNPQPDDDVTHFFKSLIPFMRMMDPAKKLKVRLEIQELILNELTKINNKRKRKERGDTNSSLGEEDDGPSTKRHKTDKNRLIAQKDTNGKLKLNGN